MQSSSQLSDYYMGFYIHSCPKMRYKGRLQSSFLLCPEVYSWHLLTDELREKLDKSKYTRFNDNPDAIDADLFDETRDLNSVSLLVDCKYMTSYEDHFKKVLLTNVLNHRRPF